MTPTRIANHRPASLGVLAGLAAIAVAALLLLSDGGPPPLSALDVTDDAQGPLTGFTLVDASDQFVLASLTDGASVELADPDGGSYAIRADLAEGETAGSVRLELSGTKSVTRTENLAPYSLYGDGGEDDLHGQALPAGSYTLTATAYAERNLGGDELGTLEVSFTVTPASRAQEFDPDRNVSPRQASTDASLSALTLSSGLDPQFDSTTTSYTSAVQNSTSQVTVTATANDSNATVAYTPATDASNTDTGHQVDLNEGSNTITVTVTAQDTTTTETYTITVWRHPSTETILQNIDFTGGRVQARLTSILMTRFTTGPSAEGYVVNAIRLNFGSVPSNPGRWTLDIRKDSDNSVVGTFHVLGRTLTTGAHIFHATSPIELDPNTTYRARFRKETGNWTIRMGPIDRAGAHSSSMFGWSIPTRICGDDACTGFWDNRVLDFRLFGSAKDTTAPALQTAVVYRDTLTLTYDDALDERKTPATSAFTVTSDSSSVNVDSVDVSGSTVVLTLGSRVPPGNTVTMTYTVPGSNKITNAANLEAAAITSSQTVTNPPVGTDATLSALTISSALNVDFDSATTEYKSAVRQGTSQVTVTATANDSYATIAYSPATDASNTDEGHQVDLTEGENTITVTVTAEDGSTTETYTITVWRHQADGMLARDLRNPTGQQRVWLDDGVSRLADFDTGPSEEGYVVTYVVLQFSHIQTDFSEWTLQIRELDGFKHVGDFHHAGFVTDGEWRKFAALEPITLEANTRYYLRLWKRSGSGDFAVLGRNTRGWGAHHSSAAGWRIRNALEKQNGVVNGWMLNMEMRGHFVDTTAPELQTAEVNGQRLTLTYDEALDERITPAISAFAATVGSSSVSVSSVSVSGKQVMLTLASSATKDDTVRVVYTVPASNAITNAARLEAGAIANTQAVTNNTPDQGDATLIALDLTGGRRIGGLNPVFASETTTYTSAVLHGTDQVTLTATTSHGGATIAYTPATDADNGRDGHQVDLNEGENTITVTVTAGDGMTTKTYTITVWKHPEIDGWLVRNKFSDDGQDRAQTFGTSVMSNRFTTGPSEEGYTINALRLRFTAIPDPPGDWSLAVRKRSDDSVVGTFHIQRTSRTRSDWEIPATEPFTLDPDTEYAVRVEKGAGTWTLLGYRVDDPGAHGDSLFGWTIENTICLQDDCSTQRSDRMLVFRLRGTPVDTTAPALQTAVVDADTLTLTYDEKLDERKTPATSAFTVTSAGSSVSVDSVDVSGEEVTLTLGSSVSRSDTVTVTYTVPGSDAITNAGDLEAAAITSSQTVTNNSPPAVSIANASAEEGDAMTFTVSLAAQDANPVTVQYATSVEASDTASSGDFTAASGTLTIAANTDSNTFTVQTTEDMTTESNETFTVTLTSPSSNAVLGTATATGTIEDDDTPAFSIAAADATEGGNITFTVTLSPASSSTTTVRYATSVESGDTASSSDFTAASGTLTFNANDTSKTFTVATAGDTVDEDDETFTVTLSSPSSGTEIRTATATGTINDNDTVAFSINDASANEGSDVTFTVTANPRSAKQVTVDYATSNGTATAGTHYTSKSGTLTFPANTATQTFSVVTAGDSKDDIDRTFTVTLDNQSAGSLADATGTGTITDNDPEPTLSIATPSAVTEGNSGTKTMTFVVTLSARTLKQVTVNYTTEDGSATANDDYTSKTGKLTFAADTATLTQNIVVTIAGDELDEADSDTFTVKLSSAVNASISTATATGTITDDDDPPALSIADADSGSGSNSESGTIDFTVSLDEPSGREVTVQYATLTTGTATSGTDYTAKMGTLTFSAGNTEETISISVRGDSLDEENETFTVRLSSPTNATLATSDRDGTGTINDDDDPPTFTFVDKEVDETNANQTVTLTVNLSAQSAKEVTVQYATENFSATAGQDYTTKTGKLTFAAGVTTQTFTVTVRGDTLDEPQERFRVRFSSAENGAFDGGDDLLWVTIDDEDPEPNLSIRDAQRTETDAAASLVFTVNLSAQSGKEVTVEYDTSGGTAEEGTDYTATDGTLTFSPGDTRKTFSVSIAGDTLDEDTETFSVTLASAGNAGVTRSTATGTIVDNDPLPALSVANSSAAEDAGTMTFTVTLDPVSGRQVEVNYATLTTDRTAEATDYGAASGTLTFAAGETTKTFPVAIVDDTTDEDNETFTVRISSPTNATVAASDRDATGTINDDDPPPGLSINDASATEKDLNETSTMTFTVSLSAASEKTIEVNYETSGGTATEGTDYTAKSGKLTFAPSDTTKTFNVTVKGDNNQDSNPAETFTVTLTSPTNANLTDATGTGTINDDEGPSRLSIGDKSVTEGDSGSKNLVFTVELLGDPTDLTITTDWETVEGTGVTAATAGEDYTTSSGMLTFAPPSRSETVTVPILGDTLDEYDETFTVTLSNENNADVAKAEATATITDNDPLPRASIHSDLNIEQEDGTFKLFIATAEEGEDLKVPVTLSEASGRDVVLNYRTLDPLTRLPVAVAGEDYTAADSSITLAAGETLKKIVITTIEDSVSRNPGFLDVLLSLPSSPHATLARARTHASISDDEATPTFSVTSATAAENDGTMSFTVTLTPASGRQTTVQYATASGTATQGTDYTGTSGTLTFAANAMSQTITVPLTDDSLDEADERFTMRLSNPSVHTQLGTSAANGTITDNDDAPAASVDDVSVRENAGTLRFPVKLAAESGRTVTLEWSTSDGTATAGDDYTAVSGGTITFAPGETTKRGAITILQDTLAEQDETFTVALASADSTADTAGATGTVTIEDDEARPRLSIADAMKGEDSSPMTFTVTLSVESAFDVTVQWETADGTATAPDDYTAVAAGTITFAAGEVSKDIEVTLVDDSVHDGDETLTATLYGAVNADIQRATATGTIIDDEGPPRLAIADAELTEGGAGETPMMAFTVTLTGDPVGNVTVDYRTRGGTATQGTDYEAQTGSLTFDQSAGETSKNIQVVVRGDADTEDDETFSVMLSNARMGSDRVEILDAEATGTILDDEPGVRARPQALTVAEGRSGTYEVRLKTQPTGNVTVDITSDNEDVTVTPTSLTFTTGNWDTTQPVTVEVAEDEDGTHDRATLTHAVTGYGALTSGPDVRVSVTDDEAPPPTIGPGGGGPSGPTPSTVDYEWTVKHDIEALDPANETPTGMWSDGTTLWLVDNPDGAGDAVYAYDLKSGERVEGLEFQLSERNRAPRGIWSGEGIVWVSDSGRDRLFAYDLKTGERLEARDIVLAEGNRDVRDFWSDEQIMWVLNRNPSLFSYDLETGELLGKYALDSGNRDPRGIWSDGTTIWISDAGASPRSLFAYRLPVPSGEEGAQDEDNDLERVREEDFTELSKASNNSPRGIWSDGDVMYVADASDGRVYTYNMPDAIDARLASLTLSGIEIGRFDSGRTEYTGFIREGVTETTVEAGAVQRGTTVVTNPPDADGRATNGHQAALEGLTAITVTVTSADGSRTRVYHVTLRPEGAELALSRTWTSFEWPGADGTAIDEAGLPEEVIVIYAWDETARRWLGYFPGLDDVPGLNTLAAFSYGATYWVVAEEDVIWAMSLRGSASGEPVAVAAAPPE